MGIEAVGDGLKVNLSAIAGLRIFALKELPDKIPETPCVLILLGETEYDTSFSADYDFILRVIIFLAKQDSPSAFNSILDYIEATGASSVVAKVQADRTLNASCQDCKVTKNLGIGATTWGGITYLTTEFEISITM